MVTSKKPAQQPGDSVQHGPFDNITIAYEKTSSVPTPTKTGKTDHRAMVLGGSGAMQYDRVISGGTPESRAMFAGVQRAIRLTEQLNRLPFDDVEAIRATWSELTGRPVDASFSLIPPFYSDHGVNITVGQRVFINQCCIFNDIGGIDIGDEVMIGPRVSLLTAGHPLDPAMRRRQIVTGRIRIERNVWIGAAAVILHGVTVGADAVVAAGAVVTRDVPAATLVAGVPARVVRSIDSDS